MAFVDCYTHQDVYDALALDDTAQLRFMFADAFILFSGANYTFTGNETTNTWDTSNLTSMLSMFNGNTSFNLPVDNWDVSNVTNMAQVFTSCSSFNQPLNNWDTSNVTDMSNIFGYTSFNQPLDNWDTSNVTSMSYMFTNCTNFNQPLNSWDTSSVTNMSYMFRDCSSFNQPLNNWNTSNVTNMGDMFDNCTIFNQPLNNWNTSNVTTMQQMFKGCKAFNQNINNWNVSNVTNIRNIFSYCDNFNQPLNSWNVGNVTNMIETFFNCKAFNQPLDSWNVGNVTQTTFMFYSCFAFNQDLSNWDISNVTNMRGMFYNTAFSTENYDKFLISCAKQVTKDSVLATFQNGCQYFHSEEARAFLVSDRSWTFGHDSKRTTLLHNATLTEINSNTDIDLEIFLDEAKTLPIHYPSHEFNTAASSSLTKQVVNTQTYYFTATKGVEEATGTFTVSGSNITVEYELGGVEPTVGLIKIKLDGSFTDKQLKVKLNDIFVNAKIS